MIDATILVLLTIAGPVVVAGAMAYALVAHQRVSPEERHQLRDAIDGLYE